MNGRKHATPGFHPVVPALIRGIQPSSSPDSTTTTIQQPPSSDGKGNSYPKVAIPNCNSILIWVTVVWSFFLTVMLAIIYASWAGGPLTVPTPIIITRIDHDIKMLSDRVSAVTKAMDEKNNNPPSLPIQQEGSRMREHEKFIHRVELELRAGVSSGGFIRWPATGVLSELDFDNLIDTRLCCHDATNQYFVCDSGQGAVSDSVGLECIVFNVPSEGGAHLMIHMKGATTMSNAKCNFSWRTRPSK